MASISRAKKIAAIAFATAASLTGAAKADDLVSIAEFRQKVPGFDIKGNTAPDGGNRVNDGLMIGLSDKFDPAAWSQLNYTLATTAGKDNLTYSTACVSVTDNAGNTTKACENLKPQSADYPPEMEGDGTSKGVEVGWVGSGDITNICTTDSNLIVAGTTSLILARLQNSDLATEYYANGKLVKREVLSATGPGVKDEKGNPSYIPFHFENGMRHTKAIPGVYASFSLKQ